MAESREDSFQGRARASVVGRITEVWKHWMRFFAEVRNEMGRVTWPSQKEVYATTIVVIIFSVAMGVYLWLCDVVLGRVIGPGSWLYHYFGAR
jgi:preprotein translocase subunit SecE